MFNEFRPPVSGVFFWFTTQKIKKIEKKCFPPGYPCLVSV